MRQLSPIAHHGASAERLKNFHRAAETAYNRSTIACANWLVFTSVAPSMRRAKS